MKKIGVCTIYTGFNYGSALQAYATKNILINLGCEVDVIKIKGSLVSGRDIRIGKMFIIGFRTLLHYKYAKKNLSAYKSNYKKNTMKNL